MSEAAKSFISPISVSKSHRRIVLRCYYREPVSPRQECDDSGVHVAFPATEGNETIPARSASTPRAGVCRIDFFA
jgi:hypothetical protein